MKHLLVIFSILFLKGCLVNDSKSETYMKASFTEIEESLIKIGYRNLFSIGNRKQLDSLWADGENLEKFKDIIESKESTLLGKFLTVEFLNYKKIKFDDSSKKELGKAYVYALEKTNIENDDFIGVSANSWGFLYHRNDTGNLGKQLISYGDIVIPDLVALLDVEGKVLYEGSQDATIGNSYQYRIKDFAAFYISKIKDISMTFYQDFEKRDAEIERLKELLENE